jgi:hypothetical protein
MRLLIAALLACVMLGTGVAFAASAYDDVPADHWAYNALDYLTQRGVLEGYPDGFFKGDRTLTRYEFAQAIARLLDTIQTGNSDEQIKIMADTLRAEFSDQLANMNKQIGEINGKVTDLDGRVGDLEAKVDDNASKLGDLAGKVAGLKTGPDWQGSFRYRWQLDNWGNSPDDHSLFRQRIAFQLGFNKKVDDAVEVGFRLKTQVGEYPPTSNVTLGNNLKAANIYLERAYVKYTPSWFGYYTDKNCNTCVPKLDIYAGIFPNITYDPHEMIMNAGENLQGMGVVYHFNKDFQILTAASIAMTDPAAEDYFSNDAYLFATEVKYNNLLLDGLDAWIGSYNWQNEDQLALGLFDGNRLHTGDAAYDDFNGDGVVDGNDRFSSNFNTVKGGLQYTFNCVFDKPLALFGEMMLNLGSDAQNRIDAYNDRWGQTVIYENEDGTTSHRQTANTNRGFGFGAQLGTVPAAKGEWYAFAQYKEIGANAIISGFGDADAGLANRNSLKVHWEYMWAQNSLVGITYFLTKMNNAFGGPVINDLADRSTVMVDWTFKF